MKKHSILIVLLSFIVVFPLVSCKQIRLKLGLGYIVTNPGEDEPEKVIQDALKVALIEDEEEAFRQFRKLLHSNENSPLSLENWKTFRFPSLRKKVKTYIIDFATTSFKVKRIEEQLDGSLKIFIHSKTEGTMPPPCFVKRDPNQGNEWKIFASCSL